MRTAICLTVALALSAVPTQATAKTHGFQLHNTTWTYMDHGQKVRESIDADGNYIENAVSGKHIDHGTAVMKDGKACFTSAVDKQGEVCWTVKPTDVGQSMNSVSDKGEKLTVTRVAYAAAAPVTG